MRTRHSGTVRSFAWLPTSNCQPGKLRRRLAAQKAPRYQATLSRDLQELRLVKTQEGYRPALAAGRTHAASSIGPCSRRIPCSISARGESARIENSSQRRTAFGCGRRRSKIPGNPPEPLGDDTVLIITPNKKSRESLQKKIEALVK